LKCFSFEKHLLTQVTAALKNAETGITKVLIVILKFLHKLLRDIAKFALPGKRLAIVDGPD